MITPTTPVGGVLSLSYFSNSTTFWHLSLTSYLVSYLKSSILSIFYCKNCVYRFVIPYPLSFSLFTISINSLRSASPFLWTKLSITGASGKVAFSTLYKFKTIPCFFNSAFISKKCEIPKTGISFPMSRDSLSNGSTTIYKPSLPGCVANKHVAVSMALRSGETSTRVNGIALYTS